MLRKKGGRDRERRESAECVRERERERENQIKTCPACNYQEIEIESGPRPFSARQAVSQK